METYLATTNPGKVAEITAMFAGSTLELRSYDAYVAPEEGETSYVDNALIKARALRTQLRLAGNAGAAVLADDSGIEIAAFGGAPGVLSARYGGEEAPWAQRRAHLLDELGNANDRAARFVCVMAFIDPGGREIVVKGEVDGEIASEERGDGGFGYDPLFYYPPIGRTFAQIDATEKNRLSHRGRAARALIAALR